jgi:hypothetical protein
MFTKIKKLKDIGIGLADSAFEALKHSKPVEIVTDLSEKTQHISDYFQSDDYEEDLDEIIEVLYILNPGDKPDFEEHKTLNKRLKAKSKFVRYQILMFVVAAGSAGLEIGSYFFNPRIGLIIGTTAGVMVVTFVAGRIIIRRMTPDALDREIRAV